MDLQKAAARLRNIIDAGELPQPVRYMLMELACDMYDAAHAQAQRVAESAATLRPFAFVTVGPACTCQANGSPLGCPKHGPARIAGLQSVPPGSATAANVEAYYSK